MNYKILVNEDNPITKDYLNSLKLINKENIKVEKKAYNSFCKLRECLNKNIKILKAFDDANIYDEHITGLMLDIDEEIDGETLSNFGFIKRNNSVRYVGRSTSRIIFENKLSLEKYDKLYNKSFMLLVNKQSGITSFDVCKYVSKIFDTKKVGHTGTLDPLADGLILVLVNKYTKLNSILDYNYKEYIAKVRKGVKTNTLDITGKVLERKSSIYIENLKDILLSFKGKYMQEVPVYSAVKVNGKKLYNYARNGENVNLPKKEVEIRNIELLDENKESFTFKCLVSKGTYIRSLIRDIGEKINYPLTMENLTRTKEGKFNIEDSIDLNSLNINCNKLYLEDIFDYDLINIDDELYKKISNGVKTEANFNGRVLVKYKDKIIGILENKDGYINKLYFN